MRFETCVLLRSGCFRFLKHSILICVVCILLLQLQMQVATTAFPCRLRACFKTHALQNTLRALKTQTAFLLALVLQNTHALSTKIWSYIKPCMTQHVSGMPLHRPLITDNFE